MSSKVNLSVVKSNLYDLLKNDSYVIPEFQRPYSWDEELCETLWLDIINFYESDENEYFLGTIVYYEEGNNKFIIDGQQRLTTLKILLRAMYQKSEGDEHLQGAARELQNDLRDCLWTVVLDNNEFKVSRDEPRLTSRVATADDQGIFKKLMSDGLNVESLDKKNMSQMEKNFAFFVGACEEFTKSKASSWLEFVNKVLKTCIILPISCDSEDTAITIFSTLNDRGMPLSDSDIIKSSIYKEILEAKDKKIFVERWTALSEKCGKTNEIIKSMNVDGMLRQYMYYLRGKEGTKAKESKLRAFYIKPTKDNKLYRNNKRYSYLYDKSADLEKLSEFWFALSSSLRSPNRDKDNIEGGGIKLTFDDIKWLHCLSVYNNDYWKYLVSVYYIKYGKISSDFLQSLVAICFTKFVERPNVNHIKTFTFEACINIVDEDAINYQEHFKRDDFNLHWEADNVSSKLDRMTALLHVYLYEKQAYLLPINFEIEHILPKIWETRKCGGLEEESGPERNKIIEMTGNKIAIDKKTNIKAGDKYFRRKKEIYSESLRSAKDRKLIENKNCALNKLVGRKIDDWTKKDILERNKEVKNRIWEFIQTSLKLKSM